MDLGQSHPPGWKYRKDGGHVRLFRPGPPGWPWIAVPLVDGVGDAFERERGWTCKHGGKKIKLNEQLADLEELSSDLLRLEIERAVNLIRWPGTWSGTSSTTGCLEAKGTAEVRP